MGISREYTSFFFFWFIIKIFNEEKNKITWKIKRKKTVLKKIHNK